MFFNLVLFNKKKFLLNKTFNLNFNKEMNFFYLKFFSFLNFFFMPSFFFFKDLNFKFLKKNKFKSFIAHFKTGYSKLFFFFFIKFKLRGLGYRAKFITNTFLEFLLVLQIIIIYMYL